jgi:uncharacterized membrane protein YkgB
MLQVKIGRRNFSAINIMRISIGIIYFWFGALKFFHGYSPAEALAIKTIHTLTLGMISDQYAIILLAMWECLVGLMLMTGKTVRTALVLLFVHMICTFAPLFLFPQDTFKYAPYGLSLVGQYIIKNIVIIASALVVWQNDKLKRNKLSAPKKESTLFVLNERYSKSLQKTI